MIGINTQGALSGEVGFISGSFYLLLPRQIRLPQSCFEFLLNHQHNFQRDWVEQLD